MRRWTRHAHLALGLAGLGAALWMLGKTDFAAVHAFGAAAVVVVALEGVRPLAETLASRALLGSGQLPWGPLIRVHYAGYAIAMVMPAGRTVAETSKAVMLRRWIGGGRSAGVGATNQALVMLAAGLAALPCAAAATFVLEGTGSTLGAGATASAIAAQGVVLCALGGGLLLLLRNQRLAAWLAARIPRIAGVVHGATEGARVPGVPAALLCFLAHRAVQAAQLAILLRAWGPLSMTAVLVLTGATIVGTSVGVAVPGQLGMVGGALALAAPSVGLAPEKGLALALMLHAAQFSWVVVGFAAWATTPREPTAAPGGPPFT